MPHLATIVARLLVKSLKRYKACLELLLPALLTLVLPIQVALSALSRGTLSPADRLPAAIFALQLTVLSILTSYAFIPRTAQVLRAKPPSLRTSDLLPRKRALAAAVFLLGGLRLLLGPGRYALPAFAFVALFFAFWPWVRQHANLGSRLIKKGVRLWRQRSFSERMTIAFAFVLAQAAPLALGRAASVAVGAMGGPNLAWTIQAIMAAGLLPLHLLILITLGTKLRYSRTT
jgi:hypothetical protein